MASNGVYHGFAGRLGQGVFVFAGAVAVGAALERGLRDHRIHHYHHHALSDDLQGAVDAIVAVPVPVMPDDIAIVDIEPLTDSQGNPVLDSRGNPIPKDPMQRSKQVQQQQLSGSSQSRFSQWRQEQDKQNRQDDRSRY